MQCASPGEKQCGDRRCVTASQAVLDEPEGLLWWARILACAHHHTRQPTACSQNGCLRVHTPALRGKRMTVLQVGGAPSKTQAECARPFGPKYLTAAAAAAARSCGQAGML